MLKRSEIRSVHDAASDIEMRVPSPSVKVLQLCLRNGDYGGLGQPTRHGTHFRSEKFFD